jgi:hypothetical protein
VTTKELQEKIVSQLKDWKKIENAAVASTGNIINKTENPVVRLIMELIQRDSQFHYRVQQFIIDSITNTSITLTPEDLGGIWEEVEKHNNIEKRTIALAECLLKDLQGKKMVIPEYLLHYLQTDEKKHSQLLESLEIIKKGMYPYG